MGGFFFFVLMNFWIRDRGRWKGVWKAGKGFHVRKFGGWGSSPSCPEKVNGRSCQKGQSVHTGKTTVLVSVCTVSWVLALVWYGMVG